MQTSQEIDDELIGILEGYKQRAKLQRSLRAYVQEDYRSATEKGRSLTSILTQMEGVELDILQGLAKLVGGMECMCTKQGIAPGGLDSIRLFGPHKAIEELVSERTAPMRSFVELGCKTYTMLIQQPNEKMKAGEVSGLVDARRVVQLGDDVYDVVAMIQALIRMWSLVLESNLNCEKHAFVSRSRSVDVDMWVNGGFLEATAKLLPPTKSSKPVLVVSPELAVIKQDIQNRLKRIVLQYGERYDSRGILRKLCGRDTQERKKAYERVILKMQVAEDSLLHELYHLGDNVKKYLAKCNRTADFRIVESFEPYRWCGNYVNSLKHGSRGKNRPSAMPGYQFIIYDRIGPKPTIDDKIVECLFLINIDGRLECGMEIAHRLIDMWFLFLRYHSDIDLANITARINGIRATEFVGKALYSAKIPDGVLDDAKKQAQERRKLNL